MKNQRQSLMTAYKNLIDNEDKDKYIESYNEFREVVPSGVEIIEKAPEYKDKDDGNYLDKVFSGYKKF